MIKTACIVASHPGIAEPEWLRAGQNLRDVALRLRLMVSSGASIAIATVVSAHGTVLRQPGTVTVVSESGETIGFNPAGPLDEAIRDLASEALMTGQDRLQRLEIEHDAASYIGLSGAISLDVHATRVQAGDPMFGRALRYLDNGAATVLVTGIRGISGHAVIGADRVAGRLSRPELPVQIIDDARSMLGSGRTVAWTYRLGSGGRGAGVQVWMQAYPESDTSPELRLETESLCAHDRILSRIILDNRDYQSFIGSPARRGSRRPAVIRGSLARPESVLYGGGRTVWTFLYGPVRTQMSGSG